MTCYVGCQGAVLEGTICDRMGGLSNSQNGIALSGLRYVISLQRVFSGQRVHDCIVLYTAYFL